MLDSAGHQKRQLENAGSIDIQSISWMIVVGSYRHGGQTHYDGDHLRSQSAIAELKLYALSPKNHAVTFLEPGS